MDLLWMLNLTFIFQIKDQVKDMGASLTPKTKRPVLTKHAQVMPQRMKTLKLASDDDIFFMCDYSLNFLVRSIPK